MHRFLYTRLYDQDKGYAFYIPPRRQIGILGKAIASDLFDDKIKLLFLYNNHGEVTCGVREQLHLTDYFGRLRCNFTGFQFSKAQVSREIPFFIAFSKAFPFITTEAVKIHDALDKDFHSISRINESEITFENRFLQTGNDWDENVRSIKPDSQTTFLRIFDEKGRTIVIPETPAQETIKSKPSHQEIGIKSNVILTSSEKTIIPPPEVSAPKQKKKTFKFWRK